MKIIADGCFSKIEDVTREYLVSRNIEGIILDVDNTIVKDGETQISEAVTGWLENVRLPVCLLSNGREQRVKLLANKFGLRYIYKAGKPLKKGYFNAAGLLGIEDMGKIAVIGDQLFSDILGGKTSGCYTIKVEPIDSSSDPLTVKIKRWFERFVS